MKVVITNQTLNPQQKAEAEAALVSLASARAIENATKKAKAEAGVIAQASKTFANDGNGADGVIESAADEANRLLTLGWLNAYNAPHWMDIGNQMQYQGDAKKQQPGATLTNWRNTQTSPDGARSERYGVSWLRDLMLAANSAASSIQGVEQFRLNSITDGNQKSAHSGAGHEHSMGMALDMGTRQYISSDGGNDALSKTADPLTLNFLKTDIRYRNIPNETAYINNQWDYENAKYLTGLLPNGQRNNTNNYQAYAFANFVAMYTATQPDTTSENGSWDELAIAGASDATAKNRIRSALFGGGTQASSLIRNAWIGGNNVQQNPYENINHVLDKLGIEASALVDHHNHFHLGLRPPKLAPIETSSLLMAELEGKQIPIDTPFEDSQIVEDLSMLILDSDISLPQQQVIMLAQAGPVASAISPAYAANFKMRCKDVASIIPGEEVLADQPGLYDSSRQIAFVHAVLDKLGYKDVGGRYVNLSDDVFKESLNKQQKLALQVRVERKK